MSVTPFRAAVGPLTTALRHEWDPAAQARVRAP
jgi:hypothetical protein